MTKTNPFAPDLPRRARRAFVDLRTHFVNDEVEHRRAATSGEAHDLFRDLVCVAVGVVMEKNGAGFEDRKPKAGEWVAAARVVVAEQGA